MAAGEGLAPCFCTSETHAPIVEERSCLPPKRLGSGLGLALRLGFGLALGAGVRVRAEETPAAEAQVLQRVAGELAHLVDLVDGLARQQRRCPVLAGEGVARRDRGVPAHQQALAGYEVAVEPAEPDREEGRRAELRDGGEGREVRLPKARLKRVSSMGSASLGLELCMAYLPALSERLAEVAFEADVLREDGAVRRGAESTRRVDA